MSGWVSVQYLSEEGKRGLYMTLNQDDEKEKMPKEESFVTKDELQEKKRGERREECFKTRDVRMIS